MALRQQLNEAKQQLLQQAEYCTQMGAVTCTLLWGVSSSEEVVKTILGGVSCLALLNVPVTRRGSVSAVTLTVEACHAADLQVHSPDGDQMPAVFSVSPGALGMCEIKYHVLSQ